MYWFLFRLYEESNGDFGVIFYIDKDFEVVLCKMLIDVFIE